MSHHLSCRDSGGACKSKERLLGMLSQPFGSISNQVWMKFMYRARNLPSIQTLSGFWGRAINRGWAPESRNQPHRGSLCNLNNFFQIQEFHKSIRYFLFWKKDTSHFCKIPEIENQEIHQGESLSNTKTRFRVCICKGTKFDNVLG